MSVSLGDRNGSAKKMGPRRDGPEICLKIQEKMEVFEFMLT